METTKLESLNIIENLENIEADKNNAIIVDGFNIKNSQLSLQQKIT